METSPNFELPWIPKKLWAIILMLLTAIVDITSLLLGQMEPKSVHFEFPWQPIDHFLIPVFFMLPLAQDLPSRENPVKIGPKMAKK